MKESAIEWLLSMLDYNEKMLGIKEIIEQAKEMEKEKDARIKELETFLEEEIIEDVYHYMGPLWRGATKLLKSKLEEDE